MSKDSRSPDINPEANRHKGKRAAPDPLKDASRYERYAATQAAADGVEGDVKKKNKTEDEKLGAQMTDRR